MESDEDMLTIFSEDDDDLFPEPIPPEIKSFKTLTRKTIEKLSEEDVNTVKSLLSVPRTLACSLLVKHKWSVQNVLERCIEDRPEYREPVRVFPEKIGLETSCKICLRESNPNPNLEFLSLACDHLFCVECWERHVSSSIQNGPGCLTLTCPEPGCESTVGSDLIDDLASVEDRRWYHSYFKRSYVERCKRRRWCPSPVCELAVELDPASGRSSDVTCDCSYKFCFGCGEESHRPLDCETVRRWAEKNALDSESSRWILDNTKPCPECKRPIEKDQGSIHVTCLEPCGHGFCWTCLGPWLGYGQGHRCESYQAENPNNKGRVEDEARAEMERYMHYFERSEWNRRLRLSAMLNLSQARSGEIAKVSELLKVTERELRFVVDAWERVIECRRVLRWSYAKAYYMAVEEGERLKFFEFLQGQAESVLEKLHDCLEKEMDAIKAERDVSKLRDFKCKAVDLTHVAGVHFEEFVRALEEENKCLVDEESV